MEEASSSTTTTAPNNKQKLVVATRIHLGNAKSPPSEHKLDQTVSSFVRFCSHSFSNNHEVAAGVIAVDATPNKIAGFNLVEAVQAALDRILAAQEASNNNATTVVVLPVTPWGKFVHPLNTLVGYAITTCQADWIVFVSAETSAPQTAMDQLLSHMKNDDDTTLVAGACLPGHDYQRKQSSNIAVVTELNGRTCPWNTLAVWNLQKLALTGFQLVSDGLLTAQDPSAPSYGVEEVIAVALLQKLLGPHQAKAKLVALDGVTWQQDFDDEERKAWHEEKMKSKLERAARQLELTGLSGIVHHC